MASEIERIRELRQQGGLAGRVNTTTDVEGALSNIVQDTQANLQTALQNSPRAKMLEAQRQVQYQVPEKNNTQQEIAPQDNKQLASFNEVDNKQGTILPGKAPITQVFGNYNPQLEPSKSGRNWGVDFGVKAGTPLALPPGEWDVVQAFNVANKQGYTGNKENSGYGNSVLVKNAKTGEILRFSHLSGVNVQPGKRYTGGTVLGSSGASGNVSSRYGGSGAHLDLEYKDSSGRFRDITKSRYAKNIFGA